MKDVAGRELAIGDRVAFAHGGRSALYVGTVTRFTAKSVAVKEDNRTYETIRHPSDVSLVKN